MHQCVWSETSLPNSLAAILECYQAHVVRAEIDIAQLLDEDFLVVHDLDLGTSTDASGMVGDLRRADAAQLRLVHGGIRSDHTPALLSEVVEAIAGEAFPTVLELDVKDWRPWEWRRVEELVRLVEPVKERIIFGGGADWNLRRLRHVDESVLVGFTPMNYLDWVPENDALDPLPGVRGAYGYLDRHPLACERLTPTADYLRDRLGGVLRLVPGAREVHMRLSAAERMLADGLSDLADLVHACGMQLDVWTLNAGTDRWRERLQRALDVRADVITTETPRALAIVLRGD
ncbi:MAG: hypothetical protein NVSMB2_14160 [Chloroflexota bacterium]